MLVSLAAAALAGLLAAEPAPLPPPASSGLEVVPPVVRPGDALLLQVDGAERAPGGTLSGRPLRFFPAGAGRWRALAALPAETTPGTLVFQVEVGGEALPGELSVVEPGFTRHALSLDRRYVEPPRSVQRRLAEDRAAFAAAFAQPFAPPLFERSFDWPRHAPTSGRYGDQRVLNGKVSSVHYGLDITGPRGAPVAAANDGRVVIARSAYLSGNTVVIWHGAGLYTAYFHLDRMAVRAGQRVERGQIIGALGATGRATGPHLHFGVKLDGLYVDPESILAIDFEAGRAPPRRAGPSREAEPPEAETSGAEGPAVEPAGAAR